MNWKVYLPLYTPFLVLSIIFLPGGMIGFAIAATVAWIPVMLIVKLFNIDMNVYYDKQGKPITKEEYEKIENPTDYGFRLFPKFRK